MKILRTEVEGTIVVAVSGLFERGRATIELFNELRDELKKKPQKLIMDLGNMAVMDSMALGLLVGLYLNCKELGVEFALTGVTQDIMNLLNATNLTQIIPASAIVAAD